MRPPKVVPTRPWWRDWPWHWRANRRTQRLRQAVVHQWWSDPARVDALREAADRAIRGHWTGMP